MKKTGTSDISTDVIIDVMVESVRRGDAVGPVEALLTLKRGQTIGLGVKLCAKLEDADCESAALTCFLTAFLDRAATDSGCELLLDIAEILSQEGQHVAAVRCVFHLERHLRPGAEETEPRQHDEARALVNVDLAKGMILARAGEIQQASLSIEKAVSRCQALAAAGALPTSDPLLARALTKKADITLWDGRHADALSHYERARRAWQAARCPSESIRMAEMAGIATTQAIALVGLGRLEEALQSCDSAIAYYHKVAEGGERPSVLESLASALNNKASVLRQQKRWRQAVECYDQALRICLDLARSERRKVAALTSVTSYNKAETLLQLGRPEEAERCYDAAITGYLELLATGFNAAGPLATSFAGKTRLFEAQHRTDEALACHERVIQWRQSCAEFDDRMRAPYIGAIRDRLALLLSEERWPEAARDVMRALRELNAFIQRNDKTIGSLVFEAHALATLICGLPVRAREQLFAALGKDTSIVREFLASCRPEPLAE